MFKKIKYWLINAFGSCDEPTIFGIERHWGHNFKYRGKVWHPDCDVSEWYRVGNRNRKCKRCGLKQEARYFPHSSGEPIVTYR